MSELILAVDTTHEFGSLALLDGTEVIEEVLLHSPEGFGQILFGSLASLLGPARTKHTRCGLLWRDIRSRDPSPACASGWLV